MVLDVRTLPPGLCLSPGAVLSAGLKPHRGLSSAHCDASFLSISITSPLILSVHTHWSTYFNGNRPVFSKSNTHCRVVLSLKLLNISLFCRYTTKIIHVIPMGFELSNYKWPLNVDICLFPSTFLVTLSHIVIEFYKVGVRMFVHFIFHRHFFSLSSFYLWACADA